MEPGNRTHDLDFLLNGVVRATADIRDDNIRLKTENVRLENLLSAMTPVSQWFLLPRLPTFIISKI